MIFTMNKNDLLITQQRATKAILDRYSRPLEMNKKNEDLSNELLSVLTERFEEEGVPFDNKIALTSIALLESILEYLEEIDEDDIESAIVLLLLGFSGSVKKNWDDRNKDFFS